MDRTGRAPRRPRSRRVVVALAGLAALALMAWLFAPVRRAGGPVPQAGPGGEGEAPVSAGARAAGGAEGPLTSATDRRGGRATYELSYEASVRLALDKGAQTPETLTRLRGTLIVSPIVGAGGAFDVWRLDPAEVVMGPKGTERAREAPGELREDVARPVVVEQDGSGRVLALWFQPAASPMARNLWRAIVASLTLPHEGAPRWTGEESDVTGRFRASYTLRRGPDGATWVLRRKERYLALRGTEGEGPSWLPVSAAAQALEGRTEGLYRQGLWQRVETEERTRLPLSGVGGHIASAARARRVLLRREEREPHGPRWTLEDLRAQFERRGLDEPEGLADLGAMRARRALEEQVGDRSFDELLDELRRLLATGDRHDYATYLAKERLRAFLILHPEALPRLAAAILDEQLPLLLRATLVHVAGWVELPPAQDLLVELARTPDLAPPLIGEAVSTLGLVDRPTARSEALLRELAGRPDSDLYAPALLGIASYAHKLAQAAPDRRQGLADFLLAQAPDPRDRDAFRLYLEALGNAGLDESAAFLIGQAESQDASMRAVALGSLRFVDTPEVVPFLEERLFHDGESEARTAALWALTFKDPGEVAPILSRAAEHPDPAVRRQVLRYVAGRIASLDEAAGIVTRMAASDPAPEIREDARAILDQLATGQS